MKTSWTITDGSAGMQSQVIGLASALGTKNTAKICRRRKPFAWLPAGLYYNALEQLTEDSDSLAAPWPDLLITCGRRSVPLALAINKLSKGQTRIIHIQDPHVNPARFDIVVCPEHDKLAGLNVVHTQAALHRVTNAKLAIGSRQLLPHIKHLPRPYHSILLGGSSNSFKMTAEAALELARQLRSIHEANGGSLLITPSRRTDEETIATIKNALTDIKNIYFPDLNEYNPFMGLLGMADYIFVTDDSVSMMTEACFTGKPVYLLPLQGHKKSKPKSFANKLIDQGYARQFSGKVESWVYTPMDDRKHVVAFIERTFAKHGKQR